MKTFEVYAHPCTKPAIRSPTSRSVCVSGPISSTMPAKSQPTMLPSVGQDLTLFPDQLIKIPVVSNRMVICGDKIRTTSASTVNGYSQSVGFCATVTTFTKICLGPGFGTSTSLSSIFPPPTVTIAFILLGVMSLL